MAAPYTSVTVSNYNANPPSDDGSQTEANRVTWATIKGKLPDPLKTALEAINTNVVAAFGKIIGGAGVTTTAISASVTSAMQGQIIVGTGAGITITTPDAADVDDPFWFLYLNTSSGTQTLDGFGSQTVNGSANITIGIGAGCLVGTDGSNWYAVGLQAIPQGKQLMYGDIINGTITESNGSNAVTFALKTLAGADPSASDPVLVCFRNATVGTGNYVFRSVTAATSVTIPATATMGFTSGVAGKLWLFLLDNAGTVELGVINCLSGTNIYPLSKFPIISTTAVGTGSDSAHVPYSTSARTSVAYTILGYASYESGLAAAGLYNVSPTRLQLYGPGIPLPGDLIQRQGNATGAVLADAGTIPDDDTIPQNSEGAEYLTQAITPTSAANVLRVEMFGVFSNNTTGIFCMALFQDSTANALVAVRERFATTQAACGVGPIVHHMQSGATSATTFKGRAGGSSGTTTMNGENGARKLGGVMNSFINVAELMA